ncbi:hypothetical protein OAH36_00950, partial [Verrucomicrobia bacterium]|nr:hypothetical protein [Verrucomicrobiota bacterium]
PSRPVLPPVKKMDWVRNPIDRFVLSRLENEGTNPSEEADRWALVQVTRKQKSIASRNRIFYNVGMKISGAAKATM